MLRTSARASLCAKRFASFTLPHIPTIESLRAKDADFAGLFSQKALDQLWFQRGHALISGLNQSLEQNLAQDDENSGLVASGLKPLIELTIHRPELFSVYSYAALIYNVQFFFEGLREQILPKPLVPATQDALLESPTTHYTNSPTDETLVEWITDSFGSVAEFRTLLLNSAHAIKGDGYTWLVAESSLGESHLRHEPSASTPGQTMEPIFYNLAVVNTYNAGIVDDSLRSGQVYRLEQQKQARLEHLRSKNKEGKVDEQVQQEIESLTREVNELQLGTVEEAEKENLFDDKSLVPLLCIDASPRNYLLDYGVFGKQQYLDNVWESIDWEVVNRRSPRRTKQSIRMMGM